MRIDAKKLHYKALNLQIREAIRAGEKEFILDNVNGQRYIGDNVTENVKIVINGVPGQDLAFAMDGPEIHIYGNAQDGVANTMSSGKIVVNGNAGDICGYAMRGGKVYIKGNVGYRSGIHMKEYQELHPTIIIGGHAGDFLGEYMAGGLIIVLGLDNGKSEIVGNFCGTGMHGGLIFIRGDVPDWKLGKEVKKAELTEEDKHLLQNLLSEYEKDLNLSLKDNIKLEDFIKLYPGSKRPYGRLYAY